MSVVSERRDVRAERLLMAARFEVIPTAHSETLLAPIPRDRKLTITCSPTKGVDATLELIESLRADEFEVVPHIAARGVRDAVHLREICGRLEEAGVDDVFVIGGDDARPAGPYADALDLMEAMDELGFHPEQLGVGAYPEGNPHASDAELVEILRGKRRLATYMVSQLCFDPSKIREWLETIRAAGITLPLYVGVPGVVNRRKLIEISLRLGVGDSLRFLGSQARNMATLLGRSCFRPDALVEQVASWDGSLGVAGFHVCTFNQVEETERWLEKQASAGHLRRDTSGA